MKRKVELCCYALLKGTSLCGTIQEMNIRSVEADSLGALNSGSRNVQTQPLFALSSSPFYASSDYRSTKSPQALNGLESRMEKG